MFLKCLIGAFNMFYVTFLDNLLFIIEIEFTVNNAATIQTYRVEIIAVVWVYF